MLYFNRQLSRMPLRLANIACAFRKPNRFTQAIVFGTMESLNEGVLVNASGLLRGTASPENNGPQLYVLRT